MFTFPVAPEIHLRLLQKHHAKDLFHLTDANRDHLRQWLPWLDSVREEKDSYAFIQSALRSFADSGVGVCGIWHAESLCGVIGYNHIDWDNRLATLGYWLSKKTEGKGVVTSCCRALIDHAFTEYRLNRVVIRVATGNHKSQSIPDRLGFAREGILHDAEWLYDHYVDHTINALLEKNDTQRQYRNSR